MNLVTIRAPRKLKWIIYILVLVCVVVVLHKDILYHLNLSHYSRAEVYHGRNQRYFINSLQNNPAKQNGTKIIKSVQSSPDGLSSESTLKTCLFLQENIINTHNYQYIITPSVTCMDRPIIELAICVTVSPYNFQRRKIIRETWGSYSNVSSHSSILIFFLGLPESSVQDSNSLQQSLLHEAAVYGDILQENYMDCYKNLSLKSVSILKFISTYCSMARYILKADDDVYVNVPYLVSMLRQLKLSESDMKAFVIGSIQVEAHPNRSTTSKWYTPFSVYRDDTYPDYVSGTAYIISSAATRFLYEASLRVPLFWLEDAYITGICSKKAGIKLVDSALFSYGKPPASGCSFKERISGHRYNISEIQQIHQELYDPNTICYHT